MPAHRDHQQGDVYPRAPSAGAYTAYHAYTTSAHSEVWEACAMYVPAERARAQTFLSDETKGWDGLGRSRGEGGLGGARRGDGGRGKPVSKGALIRAALEGEGEVISKGKCESVHLRRRDASGGEGEGDNSKASAKG